MKPSMAGLTIALSLLAAPLAGAADPADPPGGGGHVGAGHAMSGGGHFHSPGGAWVSHPALLEGGRFHAQWNGGHWWHGNYGGRFGWWWIVGPDWYWYPAEVAPVPDPYTPAGMTPGYWYWCDAYQQYYPYVGACPSGWRATQPL